MTTAQTTVIVSIDGSEQSLAAVRTAAVEAFHRQEALRIVHAFIWQSLHVDVGPVADLPGTGLRHHAEDLLAEAAVEAGKAAPQVPVTTALVDGSATPVLLEESRRSSLLVLGDRGLGGLSGLIIGSVAVHAAAHAHCPVLVVRGTEPATGPVVVGVDGSEASQLAVGFAFAASAQRGAELVAVHVWNDAVADGSSAWRERGFADGLIEQQARRTLSESLAGWHQQYPDVVVRPVPVRGHPRHALVGWSRKAQLVVLGTHGRDTFKGLVLGSVSQAVLHHSACPVAVVRESLSPPGAIDLLDGVGDLLDGVPDSSVGLPQDNVDRFLDRPVNAVSALVPGRQRVDEVLEDLRSRGTDVSGVVLLHGPQGVHILDTDGKEHGWRARFVRFFQNWGYDDAVLNLYDEGLRNGESVLVVPSTQDDRMHLAELLHRRGGHAIHYFGIRNAESLSGP